MRYRILAVFLTLAAFLGSLGSVYATETETETEPIVVDVSEGSVEAIAEAVSESNDTSLTIGLRDGTSVTISGEIYEAWSGSNRNVIVSLDGILYAFNCDQKEGGTYADYVDDVPYLKFASYYMPGYNLATGEAITANTFEVCPLTDVLFNDFDIKDTSGNVLLEEYDGTTDTEEVYYNITFICPLDDAVVGTTTTQYMEIPTLTKEGYVFVGWYYDTAYTKPFSVGDTFTTNAVVYAKWEESGTMAFFGGSLLESFTVMFEAEPILWCVSLIALVVIVGIIRSFFISRM